MYKCMTCGNPISPNANVCFNCGETANKDVGVSSGCGCVIILFFLFAAAKIFEGKPDVQPPLPTISTSKSEVPQPISKTKNKDK